MSGRDDLGYFEIVEDLNLPPDVLAMSNTPNRVRGSAVEDWLRKRRARTPPPQLAMQAMPEGLVIQDGIPVFGAPPTTRTIVKLAPYGHVAHCTPEPGTQAEVLVNQPVPTGWKYFDALTGADIEGIDLWQKMSALIQRVQTPPFRFVQPDIPETPAEPEPPQPNWEKGWIPE